MKAFARYIFLIYILIHIPPFLDELIKMMNTLSESMRQTIRCPDFMVINYPISGIEFQVVD